MSDSDDDYMNMPIEDVKPGIATSREHKRQLKVYANADSAFKQLPKHVLETKRRQEALKQPLPETNKGFGLLAKMGYKPGMTIGKEQPTTSSAPIAEPIDLKIKLSRTGLGHDAVQEEQQKDRCEAHMKRMQMQSKISDILAVGYQKRKRDNAFQRSIIADIVKSRKACQEMDLRCGIENPVEQFLWPVFRKREESDEDSVPFKRVKGEENVEIKYVYANGAEALPEEDLNTLNEKILSQRLTIVTRYLREKHFYCLWCGSVFESTDELIQVCPGPLKELHEDIDDN